MSDLICRKSMARCQTPGMCAPHGGCPATESVSSAWLAQLRREFVQVGQQRDQLKGENEHLRNGIGAIRSVSGCAPNDKVVAIVIKLREDAERYRRMRLATLKQLDETPDEFDAEFDRQLVAALGNGAQV